MNELDEIIIVSIILIAGIGIGLIIAGLTGNC